MILVNINYGENIKDSEGDDDESEGFFLQCGAVPASIMPASDPLSHPNLHYTALECIAACSIIVLIDWIRVHREQLPPWCLHIF